MVPHVYRVAVKKKDQGKAAAVLAELEKAIDKWLHNSGPYPYA